MKFDSNLAWRQTSATVAANRDVLLPLAGVFFLLPRLLFSLFMPEPPTGEGANPAEMVNQAQAFYLQILPWAIPLMLFQAAGTLAILTLFTDTRRPTVAEAIKLGAKGVLPYLLSQILFGIALSLVLGVFVGITIAIIRTGPAVVVVVIAAIAAAIAASVRVILVAPVIAVEHSYNPVNALRRSWELTRGNALRIALFLALIVIVALVALGAITAVTGSLAALAGGKEAARIASGVVSATIAAVLAVYISAILAAIHRQLAGPSMADISSTFE
jgi:hypothetical protein